MHSSILLLYYFPRCHWPLHIWLEARRGLFQQVHRLGPGPPVLSYWSNKRFVRDVFGDDAADLVEPHNARIHVFASVPQQNEGVPVHHSSVTVWRAHGLPDLIRFVTLSVQVNGLVANRTVTVGVQEFQSHRQLAGNRRHHCSGSSSFDICSIWNIQLHPRRDLDLPHSLYDRHVQLCSQLLTPSVHWVQFLLDTEPDSQTRGGDKECWLEETAKHNTHHRNILYSAHYDGDGYVRQAFGSTQNGRTKFSEWGIRRRHKQNKRKCRTGSSLEGWLRCIT